MSGHRTTPGTTTASVQIMCMLCPEQLTVSGPAADDLHEQIERLAREKGWHRHERVPRQPADVCPSCFTAVGRAWERRMERATCEQRTAAEDFGQEMSRA